MELNKRLLLLSVLLVGLLLLGCSSKAPEPSGQPTQVPTQQATAIQTNSVQGTATPEATVPSPTLSPEEVLNNLRDKAGGAIFATLGKEAESSEKKDPASQIVTYYELISTNEIDLQLTLKKSSARQWPPNINLVQKTGETGKKKTVVFAQSNLQQTRVTTDVEMECNDFSQMLT